MVRKPQAKDQAHILVKCLQDAGLTLGLGQALDIVARQNGHKDWNVMSASLTGKPDRRKQVKAPATTRLSRGRAESPYDFSLQGWSVGDVVSVRSDLYPGEAQRVLEEAVYRMDSSVGVNWDVLEAQARWLYPRRRCAVVNCTVPAEGLEFMVEVDLCDGEVYEALEARPGAFGLVMREASSQRQREKLKLPEGEVLVSCGKGTSWSLRDLELDEQARQDILQALSPEQEFLAPVRTHALPFGMELKTGGEGACLDAQGLFDALEADPAQLDAPATVAARTLSTFLLSLAGRGVGVWEPSVKEALQETVEALAQELD